MKPNSPSSPKAPCLKQCGMVWDYRLKNLSCAIYILKMNVNLKIFNKRKSLPITANNSQKMFQNYLLIALLKGRLLDVPTNLYKNGKVCWRQTF